MVFSIEENKLSYISTIAVVDGVVNSSIEDLQIGIPYTIYIYSFQFHKSRVCAASG